MVYLDAASYGELATDSDLLQGVLLGELQHAGAHCGISERCAGDQMTCLVRANPGCWGAGYPRALHPRIGGPCSL